MANAEPRLDDLAVYRRLVELCADLDALAGRCWSPAASTALKAASGMVRMVASGLFRSSLDAQTAPTLTPKADAIP